MGTPPYDRWLRPDGESAAEFHRLPEGFLVRFPDQADFHIAMATRQVTCTPVPGNDPDMAESLYANAIAPLIGNHGDGLYIHGSAVAVTGRGMAFLGASRRGKTTLAGALARAGHPFLTEDAVHLAPSGAGYLVYPGRPVLRLFPDSARQLLGAAEGPHEDARKASVDAGPALPFHDTPVPLHAIYCLGAGTAQAITISPLSGGSVLTELMQHAFILDVEDRPRLKAHFERLSQLAGTVPFFHLDYPRSYAMLPAVVAALARHAGCDRTPDES